jgi:hypothetical protein
MKTTKVFELSNNYGKGEIVIYGNPDFDFTKYDTKVIITVDKNEDIIFNAQTLIVDREQTQRSVIEYDFVGKMIIVKIEANYDLESINVSIKEV